MSRDRTIAYVCDRPPGSDEPELTVGDDRYRQFEPGEVDVLCDLLSGEDCPVRVVVIHHPLPGRDPIDVVASVRSVTEAPIVLLAEDGSESLASEAISAGVTEYAAIEDTEASRSEAAALVERLSERDEGDPPREVPKAARHHLIEDNIAGIYEIEDETFSYVNRRFADIFGYGREELVGMSPLDLVVEGEHEQMRENMRRFREGDTDTIRTEHRGRRKDGGGIVVEAHGRLVEGEPDPTFLGFVVDITERKRRERRFEIAFDNTFQFTGLLDPGGILIEANETALSFGGVEYDEVVGEKLWETPWVQADEARGTVRSAVEAARSGEQFRDELRVSGADGELTVDFSVRPVTDESGDVTLLIAEGRDISDLVESERRRQAIIERVTDAVVEIDEDWRFTMVDERAEEIYETPEEELLGKYFWDVFEWGVGTVFEEEYRTIMETREPTSFEARYAGADDYSGLEGWFEVHVYPESDGGLAFYFRDITERKRREERSVGLNDVLADLMDATTKQGVADVVAEAADGPLYLPVTAVALYDEEEGELGLAAQTDGARERLDADRLLSHDAGIGWQVFLDGERRVVSEPPEALVEEPGYVGELVVSPLSQHGVLVTAAREQDHEFVQTVAENMRTTLERVHSDTLLRERETRLKERNELLSRLRRVNDVIRRIDQVLLGASNREEIQQAVCDELTREDVYTFAWFGVHETASDVVAPQNWAGEEKGYLDAVSFGPDEDATAPPPARAAVTELEPQVTNDVLTNPPFEDWRKAALNRGFQSNIALPIVYGGSLYGVLDIYSTQRGVFDDLEREVLEELSGTIAHAINAVESMRALVSDKVLDLELRIDPADHPLFEFLGADRERAVDLKGVVPTDEGNFRVFCSVRGASHGEISGLLNRSVEISRNELVAEHDDGLQYEATVTEESMIYWMLDRGAIPRSFSVDDDGGRVRVELFGDARLREFVEQFQRRYPNSSLIASREREHPLNTRDEFLSSFEDELSPRQREVLKTAYLSGYFETPRDRSATEIAESMDISQPTFSTHLRSGLWNLFDLIYRDSDVN